MSTTGRASVAVAASAAATASYDPLPPDVDRRTRTARTALNETFGPREFQEGPFKALDEARKGAVQIPTENVTFLLQQFHIAQHGHPIYPLSPEFARACVRARSNAKVYESFLHETKRKLPYKMSCERFPVCSVCFTGFPKDIAMDHSTATNCAGCGRMCCIRCKKSMKLEWQGGPQPKELCEICFRLFSVVNDVVNSSEIGLLHGHTVLLGCCEAFGVRLSGNEKVDDLVAKLQEDRLGGRWSNHRYDPAVRYTNYYHEKAYPPPEILFTAAGINYDIADPNYPRGDQATPGKILGGLNHRLSPNLANFNGELVAGRAPLNIYALARSGKLGNRIGWIARINGLPVHKRRPQDAKSVGVQLTPGGQRRLPVHPIVALLAWQPSLLDYLANQSTKSGRPVLRDLQCVYEIALQKSAHEMDREMMIAGLKTDMANFKVSLAALSLSSLTNSFLSIAYIPEAIVNAESNAKCKKCNTRSANTIAMPCGHLTACFLCLKRESATRAAIRCSICMKAINNAWCVAGFETHKSNYTI